MPVYYTICPAPVPVVKGTVFNEILTLMRRFCTNKVKILTETAKKRRVPKKIRDAALSVSPDLLEFFAVLERAGDLLAQDIIAVVGVVKGDNVQLFDSELAVFVERAQELVDHRRVHMLALRHVEARARHLVGHAVTGLDAHIVTACSASPMLTVNAPRFKMFFTVLWPPLKYIAMMSTGCG